MVVTHFILQRYLSDTKAVHVGSTVDQLALRQLFSQQFSFPGNYHPTILHKHASIICRWNPRSDSHHSTKELSLNPLKDYINIILGDEQTDSAKLCMLLLMTSYSGVKYMEMLITIY